MLREETVFGPIRSRRLGNSLGLNLLPTKGKICNFDCIYCECGWNADGRGDHALPTATDVRSALVEKLEECRRNDIPIDSITFSGDGEPTLNPQFPEIVSDVLLLRDKYYPSAKVSVLSNATMIWKKEIAEALKKVDNPILKLDAVSPGRCAVINRPSGIYDPEKVIENLETFRGNFILQTMFLAAPGFDSSEPETLKAWMNAVRRLKPREIMVYTIDRPTPMEGLRKFTVSEMTELVQPLIDEGFKIQIKA